MNRPVRKVIRRSAQGMESLPEDLHPVLRRVLAGRNVGSGKELDYSLARLHSFDTLTGARDAARLLADLIAADARLLIIADYDVDGATSCALAMRVLQAMGASHVAYMVPDRFIHGYGLSPDIAELAIAAEPDVVMTVDNGIASLEGVSMLRQHDIEVLITDHHLPGETLPDASVIVNPNLPGDAFPSKNLAGVGVMFYILAALRAELRERGWFEQEGLRDPNLANFLDLVALGTVADVVPLDYNNRILVSQGLSLIRAGRCTPGISALIKAGNRSAANLAAGDLGYVIAPRLNAAGRLTDMSLGIECLVSDDEDRINEIAAQLDELNRERRDIQNGMHEEALADLKKLDLDKKKELPYGLCLYKEDWHQGVVGILASRIKDQLQRPVIAFAREEGDLLKGSARSIPGLHIKDLLDRIATGYPDLIPKYGGHAMAAGLTLKKDNLEEFRRLYDEEVKRHVERHGFADTLVTDGGLDAGDFTMRMAETLRDAGPWGQGFPEPVFDGEFDVLEKKIVGERHLKMQLRIEGNRHPVEAIAFNLTDEHWPRGTGRVYTVYRLDVNEYAGRRRLQLVIDHLEPIT